MSLQIIVQAGEHPRINCPLSLPWDLPETPQSLRMGALTVPVQREGNLLYFIPLPLQKGERAVYEMDDSVSTSRVHLKLDASQLHILLDEELFTIYRFSDVPARPYFWPLYAPGGVPVTRAYPMRDDLENESKDHRHHRSLYIAFGSVNGTDNWSEDEGHGHTRHRNFYQLASGCVFGRFSSESEWTDSAGSPILSQHLTVTVWNVASMRMMDIDILLAPVSAPVLFGDTKEGGLISARVASSMDVPRGGKIENSYGGVQERETWGKAAHWCDYSGMVEGKHIGIAILDHPDSFRHPTYWHVRNYGLFAANPFGLSDFTDGRKEGAFLLETGKTMRFSYRLLLHEGDAAAADVRGHYLNFACPPQVERVDG
jgi:hypothetical protein